MKTHELTEIQWRKIRDFLPGRKESCGVTAKDNRLFVNGVLWILRSGARWRDLPPQYGKWKSNHKRFTRWAKQGIWEQVFRAVAKEANNECIMIDSTMIKAHQHASRIKKSRWKPLVILEED